MTVQQRLTDHQRVRFTIDDFLLLDANGAFEDYARTELIEGEILAVNSIMSRHAQTQAQVHVLLANALTAIGSDLRTYICPGIAIGDHSMPEPDIVIAEAHGEGYLPLEKVRLAVEISDSTLDFDLKRKAPLYARAGIAEYWVVDVEDRLIHQHWAPGPDGYGERRAVAFGEQIAASLIPGLRIETRGILG